METSKIVAEETTEVVPSETIAEMFAKAKASDIVSQSRALAVEDRKQRGTQKLDKGITKPGSLSYDTLRRAANSLHIARICVNVLKEKVTKTRWAIKPIDPLAKVDDEKIKEIENLLKYPNKQDSFRTLIDKILEDLLVLDSVAIEKTRYPDGKVAELHFVDAATIRPVFDEHGNNDIEIPLITKESGEQEMLKVSYLQIMDNSQYGGPESGHPVAAWPSKDFIYFHQHPQGSMEGFGYGLSPLEGVISVVTNLLNADNYNGTYFEEGSFPPVILQLMSQVGQRDLEAIREYMYSELSGNFHRPAIIAGMGETKIHNLKDLTNRDMEFMDYMQFLARLLAAAYGLSGQDIGLVDDLNRATSEVQKDLSVSKGYGSVLSLLREQINALIWRDFGYTDIEFDWVSDDTMDPKEASDVYDKALRNGTMTINEVRQKTALPPYGNWADQPMILATDGYKTLVVEGKEEQDKDLKEGDKPMQDQTEHDITKSVHTSDGYRCWMDDRGFGQPFICSNILSGKGYVIKPPIAVNVMSQKLEEDLTHELAGKGLNVVSVTRMTRADIEKNILASKEVLKEFEDYTNMAPSYDSEKWRNKFGGSRKYPYYMVSEFIDGLQLNNTLLLGDMRRDPKSYEQAIKDLAVIWKEEKEMVLGDRRADQYIITPEKRAFGFDYQFKGDVKRWENTKDSIATTLEQVPELRKLFVKEIGDESEEKEKSIIKKFVNKIKKAGFVSRPTTSIQEFEAHPVLFGELFPDDSNREIVEQWFAHQSVGFIIEMGFKEKSFSYDFNEASKVLGNFVKENPNSCGGIISQEDINGVKYYIYVVNG